MVIERGEVPLNHLTDAADVAETALAEAVLTGIPAAVAIPVAVPVVADRGYDSDPLREDLAEADFDLVAPHRKNRKKPPTNDGRKLRRYKRRYVVERTFTWLHSYRAVVTRFERSTSTPVDD